MPICEYSMQIPEKNYMTCKKAYFANYLYIQTDRYLYLHSKCTKTRAVYLIIMSAYMYTYNVIYVCIYVMCVMCFTLNIHVHSLVVFFLP